MAEQGLGMPAGKIAKLLAQLGPGVSAGGVVQAVAGAARCAQPTYQALVQRVRASPVVAPDETGWRVGDARAWLWAFAATRSLSTASPAGAATTNDATHVLGTGYAGVLERDGWAPYRRFAHARHQTCLAHLLRRCRELVADGDRGQARTPHAVRRILQRALWLRDAHQAGADTWQILACVLRTAVQQACDPVELLTCLLRAPTPIVADLTIPLGTGQHTCYLN